MLTPSSDSPRGTEPVVMAAIPDWLLLAEDVSVSAKMLFLWLTLRFTAGDRIEFDVLDPFADIPDLDVTLGDGPQTVLSQPLEALLDELHQTGLVVWSSYRDRYVVDASLYLLTEELGV